MGDGCLICIWISNSSSCVVFGMYGVNPYDGVRSRLLLPPPPTHKQSDLVTPFRLTFFLVFLFWGGGKGGGESICDDLGEGEALQILVLQFDI